MNNRWNAHIGGDGCTICNPPGRKEELAALYAEQFKDSPLWKAMESAAKKLREKETDDKHYY